MQIPKENVERFIIYPALAICSAIENLVKTVVGCPLYFFIASFIFVDVLPLIM